MKEKQSYVKSGCDFYKFICEHFICENVPIPNMKNFIC